MSYHKISGISEALKIAVITLKFEKDGLSKGADGIT